MNSLPCMRRQPGRKRCWLLLVVAVLTIAATVPLAAQSMYDVTDLGSLGGPSFAYSMDNVTSVSGASLLPDGQTINAFMWRKGTMMDLGTLGGPNSASLSTSFLRAAGAADTGAGETHAFLWKRGVLRDLGTLGGVNASASGVNLLSRVVGWSELAAIDPISGYPQVHAFYWNRTAMNDLGTLGGLNSAAYHINLRGWTVGYAELAQVDPALGFRPYHAVVWDRNGHIADLGTLGGPTSFATGSNAHSIVGEADLANGDSHAFLWTNGGMMDLGTVPGYSISAAYAINRWGQIIGVAIDPTSQLYVPLIWEKGMMIDLNQLISPTSPWAIGLAIDINDHGQIAATGFNVMTGDVHALLLSPQPATSLMGSLRHTRPAQIKTQMAVNTKTRLMTPEARAKLLEFINSRYKPLDNSEIRWTKLHSR